MAANSNVLFYKATRAKYEALVEKNPLAIYFVEDIPAIYVGDILFAIGSKVTETFAGLMTPDMKAKLDSLVESGGNVSEEEIQSIWDAIELKANVVDVCTKQEVNTIVADATANVVTSEELNEVKTNITTLETKVETSTTDVSELQELVDQKADANVVTELQTIVEQKADVSTVTELKTYVDEKIQTIEITKIDDGEI